MNQIKEIMDLLNETESLTRELMILIKKRENDFDYSPLINYENRVINPELKLWIKKLKHTAVYIRK